jgi:hypothetical protein
MAENSATIMPDVKSIVGHLKSLKDVNPNDVKKNLHTLESISGYIIKYYQIAGEISTYINESGVTIDESVADAQKIMMESISKTIDLLAGLDSRKFPSLLRFRLQTWKLRAEMHWIVNSFLGEGGIFDSIAAFDKRPSTITDPETGKKVSVTKSEKAVNGFKNIETLIDEISEIIDKTNSEFPNALVARKVLSVMSGILVGTKKYPDGLFGIYGSILTNEKFKNLADPQNKPVLETATENVEQFNELIDAVTQIDPKKLVRITAITNSIDNVFENLKTLIYKIANFASDVKKIKVAGINPQINNVRKIIDNMLDLVVNICLLALALIPVTLAVIPAIATVFAITQFIHVVTWTLESIDSRDYTRAVIATVNVVKVITLMLLTVGLVLATLLLIAYTLPVLLKSAEASLAVFGIIAIVVLAIAGLAWIINKIFSAGIGKSVYEGILVMIALIGVMLLAAGMIMLLGLVGQEFFANNFWLNALGMFLVVGAVVLAISALGYLITLMLPGIAMFAAGVVLVFMAITAMLLIGVELLLLEKFNFTEANRAAIKASTAAIIGAAMDVIDAIFNGFDEEGNPKSDDSNIFVKFFKSIFKGAALMIEAFAAAFVLVMTTVAVSMILLIGLELKFLQNYKVDKGAVINNVNVIMGAAEAVIDAVFQPADEKNTPGGRGFIGALKHFFTGLVDIIELIAAIGKLALTLVAIAMIKLIGESLKWIENTDINPDAISQKVIAIMGSAQVCIDAINQPADKAREGGDGFLKKLLKWILPDSLADMIDMLLKMGKLAMMVMCIGMIHKLAEQLSTINEIKFNEKSFKDKVDVIIDCANVCINQVLHGDKFVKPTKEERRHLDDLEAFAGFMDDFGATIARLSNSLSKIDPTKMQSTLDIITMTRSDNKGRKGTFIELMLTYVDDIANHRLNVQGYRNNVDAINEMIRIINRVVNIGEGKGLNKYKEGIDKAIEFTNVISNAKLDNLQTAANIFGQMVEFSKSINGNFEGLAETINDKILPLLEELNEMLGKTNEGFEKGNFTIGAAPIAAPVTTGPVAPAAAPTAPSQNYTAVLGKIQQALTDIQTTLTDGSQRTVIEE